MTPVLISSKERIKVRLLSGKLPVKLISPINKPEQPMIENIL
jgi:hypothetical protein